VRTFEAKAYEARKQAGLQTIIYAPIAINEEVWVNFTQNTRDWLDESKFIYDILQPGQNRSLEPMAPMLPEYVWSYSEEDPSILEQRSGRGNFVPSYQISPPPVNSGEIFFNIDLFSDPNYKSISLAAVKLKDAVFSQFEPKYAEYVSKVTGVATQTVQHPRSIAAQPVYNKLDTTTQKIVGYLYSIVSWDYYLYDLLPYGVNGIYVVLRNSCNQSVTYQLFGNEVCSYMAMSGCIKIYHYRFLAYIPRLYYCSRRFLLQLVIYMIARLTNNAVPLTSQRITLILHLRLMSRATVKYSLMFTHPIHSMKRMRVLFL
jgi:hypothetical protein